jgi:hypothetical protein
MTVLFAIVLTLVLGTIAGLHAYWGLGGLWPAKGDEALLARTVIGDGRTRMPPPWQCFLVAALLAVMAIWPWLVMAMPERGFVVAGAIAMAGGFFARCMAAYSPRWRGHFTAEPFATNDKRLYGPICLVLAVGFVVILEQEMNR